MSHHQVFYLAFEFESGLQGAVACKHYDLLILGELHDRPTCTLFPVPVETHQDIVHDERDTLIGKLLRDSHLDGQQHLIAQSRTPFGQCLPTRAVLDGEIAAPRVSDDLITSAGHQRQVSVGRPDHRGL